CDRGPARLVQGIATPTPALLFHARANASRPAASSGPGLLTIRRHVPHNLTSPPTRSRSTPMKTFLAALASLFFVSIGFGIGDAQAKDDLVVRRDVQTFAVLPDGVRFPEGITANPANGDIYVSTFDAPSPTNPNPNNKLLRFDRNGHLIASRDFGKTP